MSAALLAAALIASAPAADPPAPRGVVYRARLVTTSGTVPFGYANVPPEPHPWAVLTDVQVTTLFEALEGDRRAAVKSSPRVAAAAGAAARLFAGQPRGTAESWSGVVEEGTVVEVVGRPSADGRRVTARVSQTVTRPGMPRPDTATTVATVTLPAGGHALIAGPIFTWYEQSEAVYGPTLFGPLIPGVERLYTRVETVRRSLRTYLVLTAAVEEERALPVAPAPRPVGR